MDYTIDLYPNNLARDGKRQFLVCHLDCRNDTSSAYDNRKEKEMIVNKNRLEKIIDSITKGCNYCPLDNECENMEGTFTSCNEILRTWLSEFDVQTALEEGAHIINDKAIFSQQEVEIEIFEEDEA